MEKTITTCVVSHRRIKNIEHIIKLIQNQTYSPERIFIWNNHSTSDGADISLEDKSIEVINTNSNLWQTFPAYAMGYLTKSDYYSIIDDDYPPGPRWYETCINAEKELGKDEILIGRGVRLLHKNYYIPNQHWECASINGELQQVDMGGGSYFIPSKAINCVLQQRPPVYQSCFDMHLANTAQKYGNFKVFMPNGYSDKDLPLYKTEELPLSEKDFAKWKHNDHFTVRNRYIRHAVRDGWKLLKFNESVRTKYYKERAK